MTQREKIANNFSDAYLLAMLEESDGQAILSKFSKDFPELTPEFEANARSLDLMYAGLGIDQPSEKEISAAYKNVSSRLAPQAKVGQAASLVRGESFFAQFKSLFSGSPMWAGASLGIGVAVIIALLWQPWVIKESMQQTAEHKSIPGENAPPTPPVPQEHNFAMDESAMPEVQYRGSNTKEKISAAQNANDLTRLKKMEPKPLRAPKNLDVIPISQSPGAIMITWNASRDAISYLVEMKAGTEKNFLPIAEISQTNLRVTALESGKTYQIRVSAASGERRGTPSAVKSITIP